MLFRSLLLSLFLIQGIVSINEHQNLAVTINEDVIEDTDFWAIKLTNTASPQQIAETHGHHYMGSIGELNGYFLFKKKEGRLL